MDVWTALIFMGFFWSGFAVGYGFGYWDGRHHGT